MWWSMLLACGSEQALQGCGLAEEVTLVAEDGVNLAADFTPPVTCQEKTFVLFHGTGADRTAIPPSFLEFLDQRGLGVLNVDRRGHGASDPATGEPFEDHLDVAAAIARVREITDGGVMSLGVTEATTTTLGQALAAEGELVPDALLLIDGSYATEAEGAMEDWRRDAYFLGGSEAFDTWQRDVGARPETAGAGQTAGEEGSGVGWHYVDVGVGEREALLDTDSARRSIGDWLDRAVAF